jgi:hypothetical protein
LFFRRFIFVFCKIFLRPFKKEDENLHFDFYFSGSLDCTGYDEEPKGKLDLKGLHQTNFGPVQTLLFSTDLLRSV